MTDQLPLLSYAGTSGWKGSEASYARVMLEDSNGTTSLRQRVALKRVWDQEFRGLTWKDLSEIENLHAGQASSVLSVLHKEGLIVRLMDRRNRCSIYVAPPFIRGRVISERKDSGMTKNEMCLAIIGFLSKPLTDEDCLDQIHQLVKDEMGKE